MEARSQESGHFLKGKEVGLDELDRGGFWKGVREGKSFSFVWFHFCCFSLMDGKNLSKN